MPERPTIDVDVEVRSTISATREQVNLLREKNELLEKTQIELRLQLQRAEGSIEALHAVIESLCDRLEQRDAD